MDVNNNINKLNTIRWKAVLGSSLGAIVLAAAIIIIQDNILLQRITDYSKLNANTRYNRYVEDFEQMLQHTIIRLETEANTITEHTAIAPDKSKEVTARVMQSFLTADKSLKSVFIISEPYIFDNNDSLLVNTNPGFPIGWYAKYITRENLGSPEFSNELQTTSSDVYDLYRAIKHDHTAKVLSLKQNADVSNVITCMVPFFCKNKFAGVLGIDIDQKYYREMLDEIIPSQSTVYIADSTGNIFYSRNKDFQNRNIHEVLRFTEEKYNLLSKTAENLPVDIVCDIVENNNERVYLHNKRIMLPCNNDNFTMITIIPYSQISAEKENSVIKAVVIALIIVILYFLYTILATKQMVKPIKLVKSYIKRLCDNDFDVADNIEEHLNKIPQEWNDLLNSIHKLSTSLRETTAFANNIKERKYTSEYEDAVSRNSIGTALISLRDSLMETSEKEKQRFDNEQRTQWATQGHSKFSDILRNNISDIHKLCNAVIDSLVPYINVSQGGIFIRTTLPEDEKTECFELYAVFAYGHQRFHKRTLRLDEGMIGACAMEQHTIILNNIPDNYTDISSGLGSAKPKCIMFVPLMYNDYLYGVMEFASFTTFEEYQVQFVERISENIASTIANAKINEQTNLLLKKSRQQAQMMEEREDQLKGEIETLNNLVATTQSELNDIEQINNAMNKTMLVAIFSTKGDTIDANRKFALRYTLDVNDIRRKNVYEILQLNLGKYDEFKKMWDSVKQGSTETYNIEFKINNTIRKIRNVFVPVSNRENQIDRILCLATDITSQQNVEDELMKLKKQGKEQQNEYDNLRKMLAGKEQELAIINNELVATKQSNAEANSKLEKANNSAQFYKKELEKRIGKSRKIENNLKEKVKAKDEEIANLRQMLNISDDDEEATGDTDN